MAMADDDVNPSTETNGVEGDTEEKQAYRQGNADYLALGVREDAYNPPAGYEQAYKAGWEARRTEEDEILMREWAGPY